MPDKETNEPWWPRFRRRARGWPGAIRGRIGRVGLFTNVALVLLLGLTVTAGVTTVLWAGADGRLAVVPAETTVLDLLKLGLTVTAGIGGVVALVVAYRKQRLNETAETRLDAAATREDTKLFNERFGAAAQLLASAEPANRLAGIYAMAGLADDWDTGRQTCINVLCGYLRLPYTPPTDITKGSTPEKIERHAKQSAHRQVRHALLDLIGERLRTEPEPGRTWHGHTFDLSGTTIDGGRLHNIKTVEGTIIDFTDTKFTGGEVTFSHAEFAGGLVSFVGAKFTTGIVSFVSAEFAGGRVDFGRAKFTGGTVSFDRAKFTGGTVSFGRAKFTGGLVFFGDTAFTGGLVSLIGTKFAGGQVFFGNTAFTGGKLAFSRAEFTGGQVDFRDVAVWDVPPMFEDFPDGPPQGLHLPTQSEAEQAEASD